MIPGSIVAGLFDNIMPSVRNAVRGYSNVDNELIPSRLVKPEMVVGPQGIESSWQTMPDALREAEMKKIEEATRLFERGTPNDEILGKTGFWFDENNTIKKEIDDKDAMFVIPFDEIKTNKEYKLGDVFKHDSMFKFYPSFKDMPVEFYKGRSGEDGEFIKGKVRLNKNGLSFRDEDPNFATAAVLHEIQHAVQKVEDFTKGGNLEMFLDKPVGEASKDELIKAFRNYLRLGGEAEARNVATRFIEPILAELLQRKSYTKGTNFLESLTKDNQSVKYQVNKDNLINTKGEPIDMRSEEEIANPFYQDPFEDTTKENF